MSVSWTDIRDMPSGEFASMAESAVQSAIDEAVREVSQSVFGTRYDDGVKYLAAHLLAVMKQGGNAPSGPVLAEHVGAIGRSYAIPAGITAESLAMTIYGRRYLEIRQQVAGGPRVLL